MNSKYKVLKFISNKFDNVEDLVSIEEPLEISLKFNEENKWITQNLSITMRTPGNDKDLVRGFLFNEQIVENIKDIESIESYGEKVGQYNIQNKIVATINKTIFSIIFAKYLAEYVLGFLPKGTHDWKKFLTPEDIYAMLLKNNFEIVESIGVNYKVLSDHL